MTRVGFNDSFVSWAEFVVAFDEGYEGVLGSDFIRGIITDFGYTVRFFVAIEATVRRDPSERYVVVVLCNL